MHATNRDDPAGGSLLVLGAGYLGGAVVRAALARGLRVTALTRNPAQAAALRAAGCTGVIEADLAGDAWHAAAGGAFDFVLNCVSAGGGGAAGYRHSYLAGMESVARWLAGRPAGGTIVYTGSTGVYPQGDGARVDETAATGGGETAELLRAAETVLARGAAAAGWRWFVLRLAGLYGPGRCGLLEQLRAGAAALSGDPRHRMNLVHRDDAAAAIRACFAAPAAVRDTVFNVSDNAPAPRAEVAAWLAERLGVPCPGFGTAPAGTAANPFGGRRRAPDRIIVAEKIRHDLGWRPCFPDYRAGFGALLAAGR